ncbi:MAG TPA: hypothetical protein VGD67_23135 [Pseudonocardiaceae bacterium]
MTAEANRVADPVTAGAEESEPRAPSLVDRALALTAAANRLVAGERERTEAERVRKRIGEMERALEDLSAVVLLAEALAALSATPIDTSAATRGLSAFAEHATGRPSDTVFNRAKTTVAASTAIIQKSVADGWANWASQALRALPLHRLAMLRVEDRDQLSGQERILRGLANRSSVTVAQMQSFGEACTALASRLDSVPEPPIELRILLQRLEEEPIRLDGLDDRKIALLRQVGDQIDVRRRRS